MGAHEGGVAVDDEHFAVVAQVGSAEAASPGLEGEHEVPGEAHAVEFFFEAVVAGVFPAADVVEKESDFDAAVVGSFECCEEWLGVGIPGHDVDLDVDVFFGFVDGGGHPFEGFAVVGVEAVVSAGHCWHAGEAAVEFDDRFNFRGDIHSGGDVGDVVVDVFDEVVDFLLDAVASPVDVWRSHKQEQWEADVGEQQNC